jgi:AcrR family transcriptional regulator
LTPTTEGPRARYRQQVRDEVRGRAWEQIGEAGASALSLKAIANGMGLTAPALYRYYGSRDELLTELILDAYLELAELSETATDERQPPAVRLTNIAEALRRWAVAHPQRYLLLYGTPVPGYHAPVAATALAQRIFAPVLAAFGAPTQQPPARETRSKVTTLDSAAGSTHRSLTFWTRLHGVLSLELAGHFDGMNVDPARLYQDEVESLLVGVDS